MWRFGRFPLSSVPCAVPHRVVAQRELEQVDGAGEGGPVEGQHDQEEAVAAVGQAEPGSLLQTQV